MKELEKVAELADLTVTLKHAIKRAEEGTLDISDILERLQSQICLHYLSPLVDCEDLEDRFKGFLQPILSKAIEGIKLFGPINRGKEEYDARNKKKCDELVQFCKEKEQDDE